MSVRRVSCWTPKGGCGKTVMALNLAAALAERGSKVLLVDSDPQGASLLWARLAQGASRTTAMVVAAGIPRRQDDFDWIVFDHAPGLRQGYPPGQIVVLPTLADAASCLSVETVREELERADKSLIVVANRWQPNRREHERALDVLGAVPVIRDRAVFATAFGRGATIYDSDAGLLRVSAARAEMDHVVDAVLSQPCP